jgi:hypothetical protein
VTEHYLRHRLSARAPRPRQGASRRGGPVPISPVMKRKDAYGQLRTSSPFGKAGELSFPLARIFHTCLLPAINTVALARCAGVLTTFKLFQQFVHQSWKPLKRLVTHLVLFHRAKATVLMKSASKTCEISGLDLPNLSEPNRTPQIII